VQVLIDPRGVNLKSGDLFSQFDANAAINFRRKSEWWFEVRPSSRSRNRRGGAETPGRRDVACVKAVNAVISTATNQAETRAIAALQGALSVRRGDRSFVVNVSVANSDPQVAADLANAVVKAFTEIEAIDRLELAKRLQTEFDTRLVGLQDSVREASLAVENYRRTSGLFGVNDQTALEWQLKQALEALTVALVREDQASVVSRCSGRRPWRSAPLGRSATMRSAAMWRRSSRRLTRQMPRRRLCQACWAIVTHSSSRPGLRFRS